MSATAMMHEVKSDARIRPLLGRRALVTGGSRGIGRAIALALAEAGADVAVGCLSGTQAAEEVADKIRASGRRTDVFAFNVADEDEVRKLGEQVKSEFGAVDVLVNNAGITRDKSFRKMTGAQWREVIAADLDSIFYVTRQFIDDMAERGWGRIINISSIIGEHGNFGQANYAAAKAGIIGFTKSLAKEYAPRGVTVNAIAPGFIETDMVAAAPEKAIKAVIAATPVGRLGKPEEVAAGAVYLASDLAGYVTGIVLDINGGQAM